MNKIHVYMTTQQPPPEPEPEEELSPEEATDRDLGYIEED